MYPVGSLVKVVSANRPVTNGQTGTVMANVRLVTVRFDEWPFKNREFTYHPHELRVVRFS